MNSDHWNQLFRAWSRLRTPRRVPDEVIAGVNELIARVPGPTLMLGVTLGLAEVGSDLTAFDRSETLIRTRWPGDTPTRRALVGDWLAPPFAPSAFATCVGDGVFNSLAYPEQGTALLKSVATILRSGGLFVCRVFTMPDDGETVDSVIRSTWRREINRFQSFKFRLAMAVAHEHGNPNIPVQAVHQAFEASFADRDRLAAATGWDRQEIDSIDVYRDSAVSYSFPTRRQCEAMFPKEFVNVRFVALPNYEMAERYPLVVADKNDD